MKKGLCIAVILALCVHLTAEVMLRVSKTEMTLQVLEGDSLLVSYPIACGKALGDKQTSGDMRTPEGQFTITQIQDSRYWKHDFGDGLGVIKNAYGPWFFRLSYGMGIGIHGTHDPASMGHRATEGCIRLRNEDLLQLKPLVRVGTVVEILPDNL